MKTKLMIVVKGYHVECEGRVLNDNENGKTIIYVDGDEVPDWFNVREENP